MRAAKTAWMTRRPLSVIGLALLAACVSIVNPPAARITPLETTQPSLPPVGGRAQPVAAFHDETGLKGEFVEGFLLLRPSSPAELQDFLTRYGGQIVQDDRLPPLPPEFGITLTEEQRAPTEYLVAIDLARADLSRFGALAGRAGWQGVMDFSSEAALRTFSSALDARDRGFNADANFVYEDLQAFPAAPGSLPLAPFNSNERPAPPTDAFAQPLYGAPPNGSPTNVVLAWQFVAAHGIQRQVQVAIIDDGYYLTNAGQPNGTDSDFVSTPLLLNFVGGGPGASGVGVCGGIPCPWHGTGVASVAIGALNNAQGTAGTGSIVATPILVKTGNSRANKNQGIRAAVNAGADVVVMSFGVICDSVDCRKRDRNDTPFDDFVNQGSRTVFVASAGNGEGGNGFDVGAPKFYHPCHEDHVICVGALNTGPANAVDRIQYSNFGARVDVFAPTNIPAMSYPDSSGTVGPRIFAGTSASTPYVAGIAAMMKAIAPSLTSDQVGEILRRTATPGVGEVTRVVNALAAVREVANPFAMVNDRYEPNSIEAITTNLPAAASYAENNLNADMHDRDLFRFNVPGGSIATIDLQYATGLGAVSLFDLHGDGGPCAAPAIIRDTARPDGNGRQLVYRLAGGPHVLETRANAIIGYNLGINFTLPLIPLDDFEENDTVPKAKYLYSFTFGNGIGGTGLTPGFTRDATIHHPADIDYYIVRGVDLTGKEIGLTGTSILFNTPALMLYGNDSKVDLQVFELSPANTAGPLIAGGHLVADSCAPEPLTVHLKSNSYYLVRVAGDPGRYTLYNGVDTSSTRHPIKVRDKIYEVLHPGEPIENPVRYTQYYLLPSDPEFVGLTSDDPRIHLRLLEADGDIVSEGVPGGAGESVSFGSDRVDSTRYLEVGRREAGEDVPTLRLAWNAVEPRRTSGNLVENGNAEVLGGGNGTRFANWEAPEGLSPAQPLQYERDIVIQPGNTTVETDGQWLFAATNDGHGSGLRQVVVIGSDWRGSIDQGRAKALFSALLGGRGRDGSSSAARIRYLDDQKQPLGELALAPVGSREREGKTALVRTSANEYLPKGTAVIVVEVNFGRTGERVGAAFADEIALTLADYGAD